MRTAKIAIRLQKLIYFPLGKEKALSFGLRRFLLNGSLKIVLPVQTNKLVEYLDNFNCFLMDSECS